MPCRLSFSESHVNESDEEVQPTPVEYGSDDWPYFVLVKHVRSWESDEECHDECLVHARCALGGHSRHRTSSKSGWEMILASNDLMLLLPPMLCLSIMNRAN